MDLFGDLPPANFDDGTSTSSSTTTGKKTLLKPRTTATAHLMQPPKRAAPRAPSTVQQHGRPRTAVVQAPIEIHGPNQHASASMQGGKRWAASDESGLSELEEMGMNGEGGEAYDPVKPNDYMEYCKERLQKKKQEERQREYEKYRKEREEEQGLLLPGLGFGATVPVVPPGRGRGRGGVNNLPSWMAAKSVLVEGAGGGEVPTMAAPAVEPGNFEDADQGTPSKGNSKSEGLGVALLKKMGYKEGTGLGRDEQGITKAIHARATGGGRGTIQGPQQSSARNQPGPSAVATTKRKRGLFSNPTKVVLLKNMVGPGQVDDDLQAETAEECSKHGPVVQCLVFEVKDPSVPEEERVRTFVAFERQESAVKAYVAMNGRFFGGRQVVASFFDEDRFAQRDLAPREPE